MVWSSWEKCSVWKQNARFLINELSVKASETNLKACPKSNNRGKEDPVFVRLPVTQQHFIDSIDLQIYIPFLLYPSEFSLSFPLEPSLDVPHKARGPCSGQLLLDRCCPLTAEWYCQLHPQKTTFQTRWRGGKRWFGFVLCDLGHVPLPPKASYSSCVKQKVRGFTRLSQA